MHYTCHNHNNNEIAPIITKLMFCLKTEFPRQFAIIIVWRSLYKVHYFVYKQKAIERFISLKKIVWIATIVHWFTNYCYYLSLVRMLDWNWWPVVYSHSWFSIFKTKTIKWIKTFVSLLVTESDLTIHRQSTTIKHVPNQSINNWLLGQSLFSEEKVEMNVIGY